MGKYKFTNKLMFAIIMRDPVACKKFIEMIFPERKVEKIFFAEEANAGKQPATVGEIAAEVEKTMTNSRRDMSFLYAASILLKRKNRFIDLKCLIKTYSCN